MKEKVQKVLARLGCGSRRKVETMIKSGRVNINGKIITLGDRVSVTPFLQVYIDGCLLKINSRQHICRVLAYNKPEGVICTNLDPQGRLTIFHQLPPLINARWIAVGRLDINTSGLLLLTTDGELANRLMHPRYGLDREYAVRVFGKVCDDKIRSLMHGIRLDDGIAFFKKIVFVGGSGINQWYHVVLTEGRNREVRRLWEMVGVKVNRLIRIRYGSIKLSKNLPHGKWLELSLKEVNCLKQFVHCS